ncbi:MAG TPA: PilZ domain-containing protein [Gaiellaceae bacterium]
MKLRPPELNERISVLLGDGRELKTRVEDVDLPDLIVAPPSDNGVVQLLALDEEVTLEWTNERGLLQGAGRVVGRVEVGVPFVRIRLDRSSIVQRRDHVRVEWALTIDVRARGEKDTTITRDISGAGLRAEVKLALDLDDSAGVVLYLGDGPPIETRARVVRVEPDDVYAFQFTNIDAREQERLIRCVFAAHRRMFARVRRSA